MEHIIPESLGNTEHVLLRGIVCDGCNNYFSHKVERPLLESDYFRQVRHRNEILNKRARVPTVTAFHVESQISVEIGTDEGIYASNENESQSLTATIFNLRRGTFIIPLAGQPDRYTLSRFLGKVALEVIADRLHHIPGGLDEVVDKPELDELRAYVRYGSAKMPWPFHMRRIYPEAASFFSKEEGYHEVLHEYSLLYTPTAELYLVLAIFGVEYAMNLGWPTIDGYIQWLNQNANLSPLYPENPHMYGTITATLP